MKPTKKYDGCISLQNLSWPPDYEMPLKAIFKNINPNWLAITSLFYEGDITCRIEVEEHKKEKKNDQHLTTQRGLIPCKLWSWTTCLYEWPSWRGMRAARIVAAQRPVVRP